ncbi:24468_t:CDS:2, partial [Gigaspora margarita]
MPQKIIKKVCQSYTFKEKVIVVRYALREGNLRATVKFDLDKTQVGRWVTKLKNKLDELNRWISKMRSAALAVTYNSLKFEMLRIISETASKSNDLEKRQLARNLKCTELHTVCEWVLAAWAKINPEIIRCAFCKCSISNTMDGSEDSEIYYDEILDNKTDEANENNPDMDSSDSGENKEDFENKENLDATIKENED